MRIVEYLADPALRGLYVSAALAGLAVVVMCGMLSVLVVVKRLGFVGQGVSHSAFGGVGVAALLAAAGVFSESTPGGSLVQLGIIVLFCIAAALGMSSVSNRRAVPVDTAIGMFLVGSMALGAVLVQEARSLAERSGRAGTVQSWESILFGSILAAGPTDAVVGWSITAAVLLTTWWFRRPLMFWALDEDSARAFGVPSTMMKSMLMILLAIAVVVAMRLAGVVLATALLVLPGATALKLSRKLWRVTFFSVLVGVLGLFGGLLLSVELDWQPGPSVVLVLTGLFGVAAGYAAIKPSASGDAEHAQVSASL